jgi:hypothetical protein
VVIRNSHEKDFRFYAADYGPLKEIVKETISLLFKSWFDYADQVNVILQGWFEEAKYVRKTRLKMWSRSKSRQLREQSWNIIFDYPTEHEKCDDELYYQRNLARATYVKLLLEELNLFCNECGRTYAENKTYFHDRFGANANKVLAAILSARLAKHTQSGSRMALFRPASSYGDQVRGSSYETFHRDLLNFQQKSCKSDKCLSDIIRNILTGSNDKLPPNLEVNILSVFAVAWFGSESVRSPSNIVTTIFLLDLIDEKAELRVNDFQSVNWSSALAYPSSGPKARDFYGREMNTDRFKGLHPMVHTRSKEQAKTLRFDPVLPSGSYILNPVFQKQGCLTLLWLVLLLAPYNNDRIRFEFIHELAQPLSNKDPGLKMFENKNIGTEKAKIIKFLVKPLIDRRLQSFSPFKDRLSAKLLVNHFLMRENEAAEQPLFTAGELFGANNGLSKLLQLYMKSSNIVKASIGMQDARSPTAISDFIKNALILGGEACSLSQEAISHAPEEFETMSREIQENPVYSITPSTDPDYIPSITAFVNMINGNCIRLLSSYCDRRFGREPTIRIFHDMQLQISNDQMIVELNGKVLVVNELFRKSGSDNEHIYLLIEGKTGNVRHLINQHVIGEAPGLLSVDRKNQNVKTIYQRQPDEMQIDQAQHNDTEIMVNERLAETKIGRKMLCGEQLQKLEWECRDSTE